MEIYDLMGQKLSTHLGPKYHQYADFIQGISFC